MKHIFLLMSLVFALSTAALAKSVDFTNSQGALTASTHGLSLSGSMLIAINGPGRRLTGNLGTLTLSTGALTSGSLQTGGTFAGRGSFVLTGNGTNGIPNGVIFSGSFSGPLNWQMITLADGSHNYSLTATLQGNQAAVHGTWFTGQTVYGAAVQLTTNLGRSFFNTSTTLSSGDTDLTGNELRFEVPEPGSMLFFGSGLIGVAGLLRHKSKARQHSRS